MFEKVCADFEEQLVEMNGQAEHIHLLINCPPKPGRALFTASKAFPVGCLELNDPPYWKDVLWSQVTSLPVAAGHRWALYPHPVQEGALRPYW